MLQQKGRTRGNTFLESLGNKFDGGVSNFVLGNVEMQRNFPIIYASDGFSKLTGYSRKEIMNRSCECNFLHGMNTDFKIISQMRDAVISKKEFKAEVFLYKKDGTVFLCLLEIIPIRNEKQEVVLFLVSHKEIVRPVASEHTECNENGQVTKKRRFSRDILLHIQRHYQNMEVTPHAVHTTLLVEIEDI